MNKNIFKFMIISSLFVAFSFIISGCSTTASKNISDMLDISFCGISGRGHIDVKESDYAVGLEEKYGSDYIDSFFDSLSVDCKEDGDISNGNEVEIVISCDNDFAKTLGIKNTSETLTLTAGGISSIDLKDYIKDPTIKGLNGEGWVGVNFDYSAFKNDYENIVSKDSFYEEAQPELMNVDESDIKQYISYDIKNNGSFSNGDTADVKISFDDSASKIYGVENTEETIVYDIQNLSESCILSPFDIYDEETDEPYMECADITFHGYSPYICVNVESSFEYSTDPQANPYCFIQYEVSPQRNLSTGDKFTITASIPKEKKDVGYELKNDSKTFTVTKTGNEVTSISQLKEDGKNTVLDEIRESLGNYEVDFFNDGIFCTSKDIDDKYYYLVVSFGGGGEFGYCAIENLGVDENGDLISVDTASFSIFTQPSEKDAENAINNSFSVVNESD